jgi:hypothetical protein
MSRASGSVTVRSPIRTTGHEAEAAFRGDRSSADYLRLLEALNREPEVEVVGSDSTDRTVVVVLAESKDPEVRAAAQSALDAQRHLLRVLAGTPETREALTA